MFVFEDLIKQHLDKFLRERWEVLWTWYYEVAREKVIEQNG